MLSLMALADFNELMTFSKLCLGRPCENGAGLADSIGFGLDKASDVGDFRALLRDVLSKSHSSSKELRE